MIRLLALFAMILGLLPLGAAASAAPASPNRNATATVLVTNPAQIRKLEDLNFALLAVTTAGTAVINPNTDTMTTTGGVIRAGWTPYAAMFEAISPVKNSVHIRVPNQPITITRVGGTETMTVRDFTLSGAANRNVVAKEPFAFKIGGTLMVNANQAEGVYLGTFTVDVQFQ